MENKINTIIIENEIPESDQLAIRSGFESYESIAREWEIKAKQIIVTDASQKDLIAQAKEGRKLLKEKRVEIEKNRKALKEQSLRKGQAIDAIAKYLTSLITPTEEYLELQEKFVEIQEQKRLDDIENDRIAKLSSYVNDLAAYNLRIMGDEQFNQLLESSKQAHELRQQELQRQEQERLKKEEQDRLEQQQIKLENERLKKELEEKQKLELEERQKREKLEVELKERQDLEAKEQKAKLDAEKQAKLAPDKDKIRLLANKYYEVEYPEMETEEGKVILANIKILMEKIQVYIAKNIDSL